MSRIAIVEDNVFLKHLTGQWHPESPLRFQMSKQALVAQKLLNHETSLKPRLASNEEILLCHSKNYLDVVSKNVQDCIRLNVEDGTWTLSTGDVQMCSFSETVARYAVGAVLEAVDKVFTRQFPNAFCLIRPPGHHATRDKGMGFCIYNNVAIGAKYAIQRYHLNRVLIVDWDVHHGNGTQDIFYEDSSVFYFSTHHESNYPGTGLVEEKGRGRGLGFTLNFPIDPKKKNPRQVIKEIFLHQLMESMEIYKPEMIFISAGFDAHFEDPLGGFNLTTQDFVDLTEIVKQIAQTYSNGRIVSVLEGGYHLKALTEVIPAHVKTLSSSSLQDQ